MKEDGLIGDKLGQAGKNFVWLNIVPKKESISKAVVSPKNLYQELTSQVSQMSQVTLKTQLLGKPIKKTSSYGKILGAGENKSFGVTHDTCGTHEKNLSQNEIDEVNSTIEKIVEERRDNPIYYPKE